MSLIERCVSYVTRHRMLVLFGSGVFLASVAGCPFATNEKRLDATIAVVENQPDDPTTDRQTILHVLKKSTKKSLDSPVICSSRFFRHTDSNGQSSWTLVVHWVASHPTATSVRLRWKTESLDIPIPKADQAENARTARRYVLFTVALSFPRDSAKAASIISTRGMPEVALVDGAGNVSRPLKAMDITARMPKPNADMPPSPREKTSVDNDASQQSDDMKGGKQQGRSP